MRAYLTLIWLITATMLPAAGGSAVYSSLSDWNASSPGSGLGVLDFEAASVSYTSVFAYDPFTITAGSGGEWLLTNAAAGTGSGHYLTTDLSSVMNIALASGVYGVALNLGSNSASPAIASIVATDVNGVQYTTSGFSTSGPAGPAAFWGLRTSVQLVSVHIVFATVLPQVDNIRYSNVALPPPDPSIPEPGTWVLVVSGLVILWGPLPYGRGSEGRSRPAGE